MIDYRQLAFHPDLEEALMFAIAHANPELMYLLVSRDREIVTRYPTLSTVKGAKAIPEHFLEAWRLSAALRTLEGIYHRIEEEIEENPHRDFSDLLRRAARFPGHYTEFKVLMGSCIAKILHLSSLLGLELTLEGLRAHRPEVFRDAIAILIWAPEYHDRADHLYNIEVFGHDILRQIVPIATEMGFPPESIQWIEDKLAHPEPCSPDAPF